MNFKESITKLQNLPDNQKKIVLWTIVGILAVIMGFFWVRGAISNFSKMGESLGNIEFPQIETSDMPQMPDLSALQNLDTADWKTYTNADYGFEFNYPDDWKLEQLDTVITLKSLDFERLDAEMDSKVLSGASIRITKRVNSSGESLENINIESRSEVENLEVDNIKAIEYYYRYEGPKTLFVNLIKGNYMYQIIFSSVGNGRQDKYYPNFIQILSTFKFLD